MAGKNVYSSRSRFSSQVVRAKLTGARRHLTFPAMSQSPLFEFPARLPQTSIVRSVQPPCSPLSSLHSCSRPSISKRIGRFYAAGARVVSPMNRLAIALDPPWALPNGKSRSLPQVDGALGITVGEERSMWRLFPSRVRGYTVSPLSTWSLRPSPA